MGKYSITEVGTDFTVKLGRKGLYEEPMSPFHLYIVWEGNRRIDSALTYTAARDIIDDLELTEWERESYKIDDAIAKFQCRR